MDIAVRNTEQAYEKLIYREALKVGFFELQASRDKYREVSLDGMHKDLILKYIEVGVAYLFH